MSQFLPNSGKMILQIKVIPTTPPCKCKYMAAPEARLPVSVRQVYRVTKQLEQNLLLT